MQLKKCPFCGGTPEIRTHPEVWDGYRIMAYVCKCGVFKSTVEDWNNRAPVDMPTLDEVKRYVQQNLWKDSLSSISITEWAYNFIKERLNAK